MTVIATAQSHVTPDIRANGREIRAAMAGAAAAGARLVHFPEAALSGYPGIQHALHVGDPQAAHDWLHFDWATYDWPTLQDELAQIAAHARRLGIWVALGASHATPGAARPFNSLHIVSDQGRIVGRYDKRRVSSTELALWYNPGTDPLTFEIDGTRFGCAICIEVVFPDLFSAYGAQGVDCMLLPSFSQDPMHGVMAQAHAATNCLWLSLSTPVCCSATLPATLFGPDGNPIARARPGVPGLLLHRIDRHASAYHVALDHVRPWRARSRSGESCAAPHPAIQAGPPVQRAPPHHAWRPALPPASQWPYAISDAPLLPDVPFPAAEAAAPAATR